MARSINLGWLVKLMVQLFCWGGWSRLWSSCFVGVAGQGYGPVVLLGWLVKLMVQLFCWGGWSRLWSSCFVVV